MARLYRRPLAIALAALTISPVVSAADIALEEVIVTATKRETTLLETPASISAFDQSSREQLGIFSRFDLEQRTPSLKITSNKVVIRGVGRPNNALGSDPGVGIYWDGVYQTENGIFSRNDYLDIERIEILRGPQGTLYGRNSIGGAVNFISTRPSEVLTGKIIAQAGNYDATTMQGLLSGPVTDKLSVLGALSQKDFGGTQKNTYNGRHYGKEPTKCGKIVEARDHVLITIFLPEACASSTFFRRLFAIYGPFQTLRAIILTP